MRVVLGVAGASGAALALAAARHLRALGVVIDLVVSAAAERTLATECGPEALARLTSLCDRHHDLRNVGASIASGSYPIAGMLVAPCSMRSLAAIALGLDDNLLTRAAGVQLKERRTLVLLTRESPLTLAHLRNMTAVTEMGGIVMPPVPAFYLDPRITDDIVQQIAARAVDLLRLGQTVAETWDGDGVC
ncbi:UbiX family flavin prenyltransferase [Tritonibacter scottomollicae]|uniref:UbiX family flavin prenyltransferase n=1 Tax=Tritonibacter scottomollicae TaxID=483013 RepID=UPI003AA8F6B5